MSTHDDDYLNSVMASGPADYQHDDAESHDLHVSGRTDAPGDAEAQRIAPGTQDSLRPHSAPVPATAAAEGGVSPEVQQARDAREPDDLPDGPERTVFTHSPATRAVWHAARARMGSPWAVLGCVMAQTVAATGPHVQLPPLVGASASLNLFVGLVGRPGEGKGTAESIARSLFAYCDDRGEPVETPALPLGSGEGIAELFTERRSRGDDGPAEPTPDRALFQVPEIDALTASASKRESTILPVLRQVYMGEPLGHTGATRETTRNVQAHSYRVCVVMGIQPSRAGGLLRDADGGTPQRVLWLPVIDRTAPEVPPDAPQVFKIHLPREARGGTTSLTVSLPESAVKMVRRNRLSRLRGETVGGMDGHLLLTWEKIAAALALMDGRRNVRPEDWKAAQVLIGVSTSTREMCREACEGADVERATDRRRINAEAEDNAEDAIEAKRTLTVRNKIIRTLEQASGFPVPYRKLGRTMSGRPFRGGAQSQRARMDVVLDDLVDDGLVVASDALDERGERTVEFSLSR